MENVNLRGFFDGIGNWFTVKKSVLRQGWNRTAKPWVFPEMWHFTKSNNFSQYPFPSKKTKEGRELSQIPQHRVSV